MSIALPSIFFYRGLYFGIYDTGKDILFDQDTSVIVKFFWAQFAVVFSETLAYPADTVKRKLMMQSLKVVKEYDGVIDCFGKIYRS